MRILTKIERQGDSYLAIVSADGGPPSQAHGLRLSPDTEVEIADRGTTLGALQDGLLRYDKAVLKTFYDERGQLALGRFLFRELFGRAGFAVPVLEQDDAEIRIESVDEDVLRLPWVLLADGEGFLSQRGWSVALAGGRPGRTYQLAPEPRLLIAMPEPQGAGPTRRRQHLDELRGVFGAAADGWGDRRVRVVETWPQFVEAVREEPPDLVYYYGHGEGDARSSALVFADAAGKRLEVPASQLARCLDQEMPHPPGLVFVNCCSGDAGGFLGVGVQLRRRIPAVITNRTLAAVPAARRLGMEVWQRVLLDGEAPHRALADIFRRLYDMAGLEAASPRWMTPVLHVGYGSWRGEPLAAPAPPPQVPYAGKRFDRVDQVGALTQLTREMLRDGEPGSYVFPWYGARAQGVEAFHDQASCELALIEGVGGVEDVRPEWPTEVARPDRSFGAMYARAFGVSRPEQVAASVRSRAARGTRLVYIRHPTLRLGRSPGGGPINLLAVGLCLRYWQQRLAGCFGSGISAILGLGFEVDDASTFGAELCDHLVDGLDLGDTWVEPLPQLGPVRRRDIDQAVRRSGFECSDQERSRLVAHILETGRRAYGPTLELVADLEDTYWTMMSPTAHLG
ncbi:MAG: hypothetical protein AAGN66_18510 [Acidobacteriota bacterium]